MKRTLFTLLIGAAGIQAAVGQNCGIWCQSGNDTDKQTICEGTSIATTVYKFNGEADKITISPLPKGLFSNKNTAEKTVTITGEPKESGTYTITSAQDGCTQTIEGEVRVNEKPIIWLSNGVPNQTICKGSDISAMVYSFDGSATGVAIDNLPVNLDTTVNISIKNVTIFGTPPAGSTYTITTTGQSEPCAAATIADKITVNDTATIELRTNSGDGEQNQTICSGTDITSIVYTFGGSATGATVTKLPEGLTQEITDNTIAIIGKPSQTETYEITTTGGDCPAKKITGTITVNERPTIELSSDDDTQYQIICNGDAITSTVYTFGGGATDVNITPTLLPTGLRSMVNPITGTVTISGPPTQSSTYTITTTGQHAPCEAVKIEGTITVNEPPTISLDGPSEQTVCSEEAISSIVYTFGGSATGAFITNLPAGLDTTVNISTRTVTISGTPTASGTYAITTTGSDCDAKTMIGTINVIPKKSITLYSALGTENQTVCQGTDITDIIYSTTGATSVEYNLPEGVTRSLDLTTGKVTISGAPTTATENPFTYTVTLKDFCEDDPTTTTGTITVNPTPELDLENIKDTTLCPGETLNEIIFSGTDVDAATSTWTNTNPDIGLVASGTGNIAQFTATNNTNFPITGTIAITPKSVKGCSGATKTFTTTVEPNNSIKLTSETEEHKLNINTKIDAIVYSTTGATNAKVTGLPTGVNGMWKNNVVIINGTPSESGRFEYSVTLIGGCGNGKRYGTITVNPDITTIPSAVSFIQTTNPVCVNQELTYKVTSLEQATYQWAIENGTIISETDSVVVVNWNNVTPTNEGTLTVTVTSNSGKEHTASQKVTLSPNSLSNLNEIVAKTDINENSYMLIYPNLLEGFAYQWYKNNEAIEGATEQFFYPPHYGQTLDNSAGYKVYVAEINSAICGNFSETYTLQQKPETQHVKSFTVSPNPVSNDYFTISFNGDVMLNAENCTLSIYSLLGEKIWEQKVHGLDDIIIPKTMPAGVYTVTLMSNKELHSEKIIIK